MYDMGIEIESYSNNYKGQLNSGSRKITVTTDDLNYQDYISNNAEVYQFVCKIDKMQRWSSLIDVIDIHARTSKQVNEIDAIKMAWVLERQKSMKEGKYDENSDLMEYYIEQEELRMHIEKTNNFNWPIEYIGGADVAYDEESQIMVGAIIVLNAKTLEVIEESYEVMPIQFPYVPGLFSFREIPPLEIAFQKLKIKPNLLICDGHGVSHPKGIGMATHLGIKLNIPTIGCAKNKLIGHFDIEELKIEKGSTSNITWSDEVIGVALRTRENTKPMYVSIGHKIDLETSIKYVLNMCKEFRQPETTRSADSLANQILKEKKARN